MNENKFLKDDTLYEIFVRDWWYFDSNGNRHPYPDAPKTVIAYTGTEERAREVCKVYNDNNEPGPLSRKAEYSQIQ